MDFKECYKSNYTPADGDGGQTLGEYYYSFTAPRLSVTKTGWATVDIPLVEDLLTKLGWQTVSIELVGLVFQVIQRSFDTDTLKDFNIEFSGDWGMQRHSNADRSSISTGTLL